MVGSYSVFILGNVSKGINLFSVFSECILEIFINFMFPDLSLIFVPGLRSFKFMQYFLWVVLMDWPDLKYWVQAQAQRDCLRGYNYGSSTLI